MLQNLIAPDLSKIYCVDVVLEGASTNIWKPKVFYTLSRVLKSNYAYLVAIFRFFHPIYGRK
jgi:hypothetical protein